MQRVARRVRAVYFGSLNFSGTHLSLLALLLCVVGCEKKESRYAPRARGSVTFTEHVAPIVFKNCAECHRPGQSAPFSLLTFEDVRKRAKQVVEVTQERVMPPWLPDPEFVHFVGERRLSAEQLGLLKQWFEDGAPEGDALKLPPLPDFPEGWRLGTPDLIVKPTAPYTLAADGGDMYRNLVIAIPVERGRFVRAIEFRPNSRAVHHAFMRFDRTRATRELDGKDGQPGFSGIHTPQSAQSPASQFASWQPGKIASFSAADSVWPIATNTDLVLQLHLQPTGKPETISPEVAFYFTDKPPTGISLKIPLNSFSFEIPAGATNAVVEDSFALPVDVEVRAVLPHAHYLGKQLDGFAILPNGQTNWLMRIPRWDFNWQGDYRFAAPIALPRGTKLQMRFRYDNSTANPRNPNSPPKSVRYGLQSSDEMAELWLQVVVKSEDDRAALERALQPRILRDGLAYNEYLLRLDPNDARAHAGAGKALYFLGQNPDATRHLRKAVELAPNLAEPHYLLGLVYRTDNLLPLAATQFRRVIELDPRDGKARGNLGLVLAEQGRIAEAVEQFRAALEINPNDAIARDMLRELEGNR